MMSLIIYDNMLNHCDIPMMSLESQVVSPYFFNLFVSHDEINDTAVQFFIFLFNYRNGLSLMHWLSLRPVAFCFHFQKVLLSDLGL